MFVIHAKETDDKWRVIDTAKTEPEAMKRYGEHRVKLGPEWLMCMTGGVDDNGPIEWAKETAPE